MKKPIPKSKEYYKKHPHEYCKLCRDLAKYGREKHKKRESKIN